LRRIFCLLLLAGTTHAALYDQRIITDETNAVPPTASELANWLEKATTAKFAITNDAPTGIFLLRTNSPLVAATDRARLADKGREAFVIRSEGESNLWIIANHAAGLSHGVYYYLDALGCRWFFPNDHWTIIPKRKSITLTLDRVEAPAFRARNFFGTGGFGGKLPVDPKMTLQARWDKWKTMNRFGGDIQAGGHSYDQFVTRYEKEFRAHPEYRAEVAGKRLVPKAGAKLCYSNPGLQQLFVEDRLAQLESTIKRFPDSPTSRAVTVEPSDGGGHCECAECQKLGSISDRVFTLANVVARAVAEKYPGYLVAILAYNQHAAPPTIAIESNTFIKIAPYAFQRTGLPGDELLLAWAKRHRSLGIYDYWAIPDWANCLPTLSFRETVPQKLRYWHSVGANAFSGESTYSIGAGGLPWYVASRVMWNPQTDVAALLTDFYEKSFGPAAPPMQRMLERWDRGYASTTHELALTFRDMQEARTLAKDDATRARVDDFALYAEYLRLWYEYKHAKEHDKATRTLLTYLWRTYDSSMAQSFRMFQLIVSRYEKGDTDTEKILEREETGASSLADTWPLKNPKAEAWTSLTPVTRDEIDKFIAAGVATYRPLEYDARTFSTNLVALVPDATPSTNWITTQRFSGGNAFAFWAAAGVTNLEARIRCGPRTGSSAPFDRITFTDPAGKILRQENIAADGEWRSLAIPTQVPGAYRLSVFDQKLGFVLQVPERLPFVIRSGYQCLDLSKRIYFYVPKGLKRLAFHAESVIAFDLYDGDGKKLAGKFNGLTALDVPAGQAGKVWSFKGFKSFHPLRPLNFPANFALSPETLLIPEE